MTFDSDISIMNNEKNVYNFPKLSSDSMSYIDSNKEDSVCKMNTDLSYGQSSSCSDTELEFDNLSLRSVTGKFKFLLKSCLVVTLNYM